MPPASSEVLPEIVPPVRFSVPSLPQWMPPPLPLASLSAMAPPSILKVPCAYTPPPHSALLPRIVPPFKMQVESDAMFTPPPRFA